MSISPPKGMISLEDFAQRHNLDPKTVVARIKDGSYVGRIVGAQWFITPQSDPKASQNSSETHQQLTFNEPSYKSDYRVAKGLSSFISGIGWIICIIGIVIALILLTQNTSYSRSGAIISSLSGFAVSIAGLFLVAAGQITRATVDNADHTREIMLILKSKGHL
ncbi:hypothetical protein [Agarivorans sp.]|uniref:hypothetical protein n=1 Tax=Agarivorans sp. TaxID=1872412 RepID=UPI003D00051F